MIPPHTKAIPQTRNPSGVPQAPEGFLVVSLFLKGAQLCREHREHHLGVHLCAQPLQCGVCQTYRLPRLCALHRGAGAAAQTCRCHGAEIGQQSRSGSFILFVGGKQHSGSVAIAGGSGAGVSVQPVGFLVLSGDTVRMLPATCSSVADRVVDLIPTVVEDVKSFLTHQ